jgi:ProP effector
MTAPATPPAPQPRRKPHPSRRPANQRKDAGTPPTKPQHPVLDWLAQRHPAVFGDNPRPLKRGIYEDLLATHAGELDPEALKEALARHTRSTRYLAAVGEGQMRRSLTGEAVESPTPEQVHHALVEVYRRRMARSPEDLRPRLRERIARAFEASGLDALDYASRVAGRDEAINALTQEALAEATARSARQQALQRAYAASGQTLEGFAAMYGLSLQEAQRMVGSPGGARPPGPVPAASVKPGGG